MKSIQWKLVLVYILLLVFALELFGVYMLSAMEDYFLEDLQQGLYDQVGLLASLAHRYFTPAIDADGLTQLLTQFSALIGKDVYLMDKHGEVVAASSGGEGHVGQRFVQQEVITALQGSVGEAIRTDPESGHRNYFYAEPIMNGDSLVGVVYASASLSLIDSTLAHVRRLLLTGAALSLVLSIILSHTLAGTITRPLKRITKQAEAMQAGDFSQSIDIRSRDEIGRLAQTFNALSAKLKQSWSQITHEKDKIEGILANLSDGLIVLDYSGRVLHINATACNWLGVNQRQMLAEGSIEDIPLLEGQSGLVRLEDSNLVLRQQRLPFLQAGKKEGSIVVLSDVTEESRLENMRNDFVANVSHELRTPLTTIKSYLEALLDGSQHDPEIQQRFLNVIDAETERMVRMVEDLLILSKQESMQKDYSLVSVQEILKDIVWNAEVQVASKGLDLVVDVPDDLPPVLGDADQLHRVLLNIIDNAISYTNTGKIVIFACLERGFVEITVRDTGIGIPSEALGRIFERFYRVDKARSRQAGGTGLGLSIAKEIVSDHGGWINIHSQEGQGAEVVVLLPMAGGHEERGG